MGSMPKAYPTMRPAKSAPSHSDRDGSSQVTFAGVNVLCCRMVISEQPARHRAARGTNSNTRASESKQNHRENPLESHSQHTLL
jgi:hypothetical protein